MKGWPRRRSSGWNEKVVITDVTRMRGDRVCVAGLTRSGECIRPVLHRGSVTRNHLFEGSKLLMAPRHVVEFFFLRRVSNPPHTEDHVYSPDKNNLLKVLTAEEMRKVLRKSCFGSVEEIFEEELTEGKYLSPGKGIRSIGTIRARVSHIDLTAQRMSFRDESGRFYPSRKITDLAFGAYADHSVRSDKARASLVGDRLARRLRKSEELFLRVGLTRPWSNPDGVEGCWLQVTAIYSFPDYLDGKHFADPRWEKPSPEGASPKEYDAGERGKPCRVEEIRERYPHAYARWTEGDDRALLRRFDEGLTVNELAARFGRQPSAIQSRIKKLLGE